MLEPNSLIKASAGTGKTFALATRFIRLMIMDGQKPETIVALTFSRAAAQEIYEKILDRLSKASRDEDGARKEWDNLLEDFQKGLVPDAAAKLAAIRAKEDEIPHDAAAFQMYLRALVETQHLGAIATLDSFILRIVLNFPKEMGFQNAVAVLDPIDEERAVEDAVKGLLSRSDGRGRAVADAFVRTRNGEYSRTCLNAIANVLNKSGWRNFVIAHPECKRWTVRGMCESLGVDYESSCPDLSMLKPCKIERRGGTGHDEQFIKKAQVYDGQTPPECLIGKAGDFARHFWDNPDAREYTYEFYKNDYTFKCDDAGAAAIRGAIRHAIGSFLRRQLEIVKAKIDLVAAIETEYDQATRRAGKLTFSDLTSYSSDNGISKCDIKNVEFRFDSKFNHWALDEFQDTGELQWRCIKELVESVAEAGRAGEGRSAMVVGDLKQSIYAWRGASAMPFKDIAAWPSFEGCDRNLKVSHRYGPNITAFVNRTFGPETISCGAVIPDVCADAVGEWRRGWVDHVSNEPEDYVKIVSAEKAADEGEDENADEILVSLGRELEVVWNEHAHLGSKETVGVLVRNNDHGLEVADYLRRMGLPVVWEGLSGVSDLPAVQAVLSLLKLAEHPGDSVAEGLADGLFGVRELVLPDCMTSVAVSERVSHLLAEQGLARTLKDFCTTLIDRDVRLTPGGLAVEKLRQLIGLGVEYEGKPSGDGSVGDFLRFLDKTSKREIAVSSDVIRILTIHRSKGLGIDHVFVPLFEGKRSSSAIDAPKMSTPLYDRSDWVLAHLKKGVEAFNPKTKTAYRALRNERLAETLRTYYVAFTRSKKSLHVIVPNDSDPADFPKGILMRDLVIQAIAGGLPYEAGTFSMKAPKEASAQSLLEAAPVWTATGERHKVERRSPSGMSSGSPSTGYRVSAGDLFAENSGAVLQKGLEAHARHEAIEWADDATLAGMPEAFRPAFAKPDVAASVWRERSYELLSGNLWETGQFDRVVFSGAGADRRATIYDFKTNARRAGESDTAFADRLRKAYQGQMSAYRRALSKLTGIPTDSISTVILSTESGQAIEVNGIK